MNVNPRVEKFADSVREFCLSAGIGRTRFYKDLKAGNIKIVKVGRRTLVPVSERSAYLRRMSGEIA
jgi:hypothetical protein